ncbi:4-(cytidine 5'-diphospho)-2-C-methyl-D-erythritol kinase [Rhizobium helianthi]|uniref:4-diphosphocytidyl-2-C-methyl-D-erythritol kinase n=1 Tax=Rhizobium helianthi TaxID=1132695 RepID=A0ABW4M352_9HYPH
MAGSISEAARAKINLALHVTGRRADGYHLLDSLVTFVDLGDALEFWPSEADGFHVEGQFGALLGAEHDNLVLRARDALRQLAQNLGCATPPVRIKLVKNLPIASGIGGGSADAAATLRGLSRLWKLDLPEAKLKTLAVSLGADVPMCLASTPLVARGIGEELTLLPDLPAFPILLANPLVGVSTPEIFRALTKRNNPPLPPFPLEGADWWPYLHNLRNDLQPPAEELVPEISTVITALETSGAGLVRMSGSGATCFALYHSQAEVEAALSRLKETHPTWYLAASHTLTGSQA